MSNKQDEIIELYKNFKIDISAYIKNCDTLFPKIQDVNINDMLFYFNIFFSDEPYDDDIKCLLDIKNIVVNKDDLIKVMPKIIAFIKELKSKL
jgi:hypothetical protein